MLRETLEAKPGNLKTQRLIEKILEAKAKGEGSIIGKMWAYRGQDRGRQTQSLAKKGARPTGLATSL